MDCSLFVFAKIIHFLVTTKCFHLKKKLVCRDTLLLLINLALFNSKKHPILKKIIGNKWGKIRFHTQLSCRLRSKTLAFALRKFMFCWAKDRLLQTKSLGFEHRNLSFWIPKNISINVIRLISSHLQNIQFLPFFRTQSGKAAKNEKAKCLLSKCFSIIDESSKCPFNITKNVFFETLLRIPTRDYTSRCFVPMRASTTFTT